MAENQLEDALPPRDALRVVPVQPEWEVWRKRAFKIGCVIYGCGSLTTALAPSLPVLLPLPLGQKVTV